INDEVRRAATVHGWHLVGDIASQFATHGYAAGQSPDDERWFYRYEDSLNTQGDIYGTIHPNVKGQQVIGERIFAEMRAGSIHGQVFEDLNADGVKDANEGRGLLGFPTWIVYLDANNNGRLDSGEKSTLAELTGHYAFEDLAPGTYVVRVAQQQNEWFV